MKRIACAIFVFLGVAVAIHVLRAQDLRALTGAGACLHDADTTTPNRARRDQAIALARAINGAQAEAARRTGRYQALPQLGNMPPTPPGFDLRLYSDGDGYLFSLKDSRDPCRFGIFSDQYGTLYQLSPTRPLIAS